VSVSIRFREKISMVSSRDKSEGEFTPAQSAKTVATDHTGFGVKNSGPAMTSLRAGMAADVLFFECERPDHQMSAVRTQGTFTREAAEETEDRGRK